MASRIRPRIVAIAFQFSSLITSNIERFWRRSPFCFYYRAPLELELKWEAIAFLFLLPSASRIGVEMGGDRFSVFVTERL
ncbi:MAG: hypothetical protein F6K23_02890 [Okeania sp. SIO2C9]|uniref:hypothetical protein n=1 Tax=Okeania sp. SIO2C9 TaxID=2607791 RepID=UPI0013BF70F4|nr:hypothetical protein [Okeania sp. SIO2C9]NEQ72113.1 hypothetical protein [Okeania sp. SIO2C9]